MLSLVVVAAGCGRHHASPDSHAVPRATGTIRIDGDWDEPDWAKRAYRAQFRGDDGQLARPSSELRLLRTSSELFVALYAADENIQTTDAFELTIGTLAVHVDVTGKVTPAIPGIRAAAGYDEGTLDNASDEDEEWVVELAIPLAAIGPLTSVAIQSSRCDVPKDGTRRCGHWAGTVALE